MNFYRYISILFLFLGVTALQAQNAKLEVVCFVESIDAQPLSSALVEIFENGSKVNTVRTDAKGKASFTLSYDRNYEIKISKAGMIQKRIDFKTEVAAEDQRSLRKEFGMSLVENCDGADVSVFSEPVDIITYDNGFGNFVSDNAHFEKMQSRFANAYRSLDQCKQDKFEEKKQEADQLFNQGNYEEAIKVYEEALQVFPNNNAVHKQISQSHKNIEKEQAASNRYDQVISEADQLLAQNNLSGAQAKYAEAQRLKPTESYPGEKITEITNTIAQQQAAMQQQKQTQAEYDGLIKKGNSAMAAQNYPMAQQLFEQAAALKPTEALATQKIAEAQNALQQQQQQKAEADKINAAYNDAMAQANAAMDQGDYIKAEEHFKAAVALKPSEALPRQKINEAQKLEAQKQKDLLAQQKAEVDAKYNEAIQMAEGQMAQKQYAEAVGSFEQALAIKPSDKYAQQQIVKINNLIVEEAQAALAAVEKQYGDAMALGDVKKLNKEYAEAIEAYQQALVAKPNDAAATGKLSESKNLLADKQRLEKEETENRARFTELVQEGDGLFSSQDYEQSKGKYEQALAIYAHEQYPKNQIAKIEILITQSKKLAEYNAIVSDADGLFAQESWNEAKAKYNEAQLVLPEKAYPRQKINEINQKIGNKAKAEKEAKYNDLLAQAEDAVLKENYDQAKTTLAQAMTVLPENPFPQQRINQINQIIDDKAIQAKNDEYNNHIVKADGLFESKSYDQSRAAYLQALQVKPNESYPQQKINEISALVSNNARQQVLDNYNNSVTLADQLLEQEKYNEATNEYRKASTIMPEQTYPQQKINEISSILAGKAKLEADKSELDTRYNSIVTLADKYFGDKNYQLAISEYNNALGVKPDEVYPAQQIDKINELIAGQQQLEADRLERERQFAEVLARADALFKSKDYANAKMDYNEALTIKPGHVHAQSQIQRIDNLMNQAANEADKKKQVSLQYDALIATADTYYESNKFKEAKKSYYAALEVIPGQEYPRTQIRKIDEKLRIIAANQAAVKTVQPVETKPKEKPKATGAKLTDFSFSSESDKQKYLDELKTQYSSGVTKEIYKDNNSTTTRYIVIRNGEVSEFREVVFKWGGAQYKVNGKPTNSFYLKSQVKPREGESFTEVDKS